MASIRSGWSRRSPIARASDSPEILIAAGGTGGHLFPGLAVADELARRDGSRRVVFAGTPRGLESRLVPRAGYPLELLPILPLNAVGFLRMFQGLLALPRGLLRAAALVRRLRPEAVLGVGGYAGGPVVLVAALLGVRTVILEPNAKPPRTGLPVSTPFGPNARRVSGYPQAARSTTGRRTRFVKPGFAFGSRITVRTPRRAATSTTGPPA
ncbi:MAG: hypothetical protein DMF79_04605 [Acidobacteria bacterium]|nr:MAG: hypothetical protein DMF79_04605 [Acidobacteriota bacterium]